MSCITAALAIAGAIPATRTIIQWAYRRRVDWIGVIAVLSFAIAVAISVFSGGNSLLLKIHGQLLTGTIGLFLTVIHIILALTLPTVAFLAMSRLVTWVVLGGSAAVLWWTNRNVRGHE